MTAAAYDVKHDPDALQQQLARLVHRRQELRALQAGPELLEPNRREIVLLQRRLASALIARHTTAA